MRPSILTLAWPSGLRLRTGWFAVGLVALVDALWSAQIGLVIEGHAAFVVVLCVLLAVTLILRIFRPASRIAAATEVTALYLAFAHADNLLSYLAAVFALPLRDDLLAQLDQALGVDWPALWHAARANPALADALSFCYRSLVPESLAIGAYLAWTGREARVREFFWLALITSLMTTVLSTLLPALGPLSQFGLLTQGNDLNLLDVQNLERMRSGTGLHFGVGEMAGIVAFPSYHTVLALLMAWVMRGTGLAGRAVLAWNLIMMLSIVPIGGHYVTDQIGGAAVLLAAILLRRNVGLSQAARTG